MRSNQRPCLYISHFLSTFNSRLFEFGAVLFLAHTFSQSLLPVSVYAISRAASAMLLASAVGRQIDTKGRLGVVRLSICESETGRPSSSSLSTNRTLVGQRVAVVLSCGLFIFVRRHDEQLLVTSKSGIVTLGTLSILACIEKLSAIMNLVSIEKDWVVALAGEDKETLRGAVQINPGQSSAFANCMFQNSTLRCVVSI